MCPYNIHISFNNVDSSDDDDDDDNNDDNDDGIHIDNVEKQIRFFEARWKKKQV